MLEGKLRMRLGVIWRNPVDPHCPYFFDIHKQKIYCLDVAHCYLTCLDFCDIFSTANEERIYVLEE